MSLLLLTAVLFAVGIEPDYATAADFQTEIAAPICAPQQRAERSGETVKLPTMALVATDGLTQLAFAAPQDQGEPDAAAEPLSLIHI